MNIVVQELLLKKLDESNWVVNPDTELLFFVGDINSNEYVAIMGNKRQNRVYFILTGMGVTESLEEHNGTSWFPNRYQEIKFNGIVEMEDTNV